MAKAAKAADTAVAKVADPAVAKVVVTAEVRVAAKPLGTAVAMGAGIATAKAAGIAAARAGTKARALEIMSSGPMHAGGSMERGSAIARTSALNHALSAALSRAPEATSAKLESRVPASSPGPVPLRRTSRAAAIASLARASDDPRQNATRTAGLDRLR